MLEVVRAGETPDELAGAYPHLSHVQIYTAQSYYHQHKEALDAEIERRDSLGERREAEAGEHPFARRMRETGQLP